MEQLNIKKTACVAVDFIIDSLTKGSRAIEMYKDGHNDQEICRGLNMKHRDLQLKKINYLKKL